MKTRVGMGMFAEAQTRLVNRFAGKKRPSLERPQVTPGAVVLVDRAAAICNGLAGLNLKSLPNSTGPGLVFDRQGRLFRMGTR